LRLRIIASERDTAQGVFGKHIAYLGPTVFTVEREGCPVVQRVVDRLGGTKASTSLRFAHIRLSVAIGPATRTAICAGFADVAFFICQGKRLFLKKSPVSTILIRVAFGARS
jgi:hypothetical protein